MDYQDKVIGLSPLAYFPLTELTGQTCIDLAAGRNGAGSGLIRSYTGPNGTPATEFNGAALVNLLGGGIGSVFPLAQGSIMAWCRCDDWPSASIRYVFRAQDSVNASDLRFYKSAASRFAERFETDAGGRVDQNLTSFAPAGWFPAFFLWDETSLQFKANWQSKISKAITAPFTRPLTLIDIGYGWIGGLSHVAIWSTLLSDAQLAQLESFSMADKGKFMISFIDYDSEVATTSLNVAAMTAGNFAAQETLKDALRDAAAQMTIGNTAKTEYGNVDLLSITPASVEEAQRELKWLVSYHDSTTLKKQTCEIGTADPDQLDPNDRAHAHIGDSGIVDGFITAFEAVVLSDVGNAVVVDEITLVGRRV